MYRFIVLLFALLTFPALAQVSTQVGNAPSCITQRSGDNSTACATDQFVQAAIQSVVPTLSVTSFGADPTGVADSTAGINSCLSVSNRTCLMAPGNYTISGSIVIGNGNQASVFSTVNNVKLVCSAPTRPGLNGVAGEPVVGACNINSSFAGPAIVVNGPLNGWGLEGISITITTTNTAAIGLQTAAASFGDVKNFMVNAVPGFCIVEFTGTTASYFNSWKNIQCRLLNTVATAQGIHIGSNVAAVDNFGDTWDNVNIIPTASGHTSIYIGSADSMVFNRVTVNPQSGSQALSLVYNEASGSNNNWPSGITFINADFGNGNVSNTGTPGSSSRPNLFILNTVNNSSVPNLINTSVLAPGEFILANGGNNPNVTVTASASGNSLTVAGTAFPALVAPGLQSQSYLFTAAPTTLTGTSGTITLSAPTVIFNPSGSFTATLPSASASSGAWMWFKNLSTTNAVISASSNVVPLGSTTAGTALLSGATPNKWVVLQSDGTNWITMSAN